MSGTTIRAGFIPLVDCAPFAIAREIGFAAEEGLTLDLRSAPSWSALRDALALDQVDAAHMLAPVPVATALGLGGVRTRFEVLALVSVNGNSVGVSNVLADRLVEVGHDFAFTDAAAAGQALLAASAGRLRIGVPFPFSMHAELIYHWLGAVGFRAPQDLDVRTVPPPRMAAALGAGEIDAFCVGEPWGSFAVEARLGALLLPGAAIWAGAPEKVLAVRGGWADADPDRAHRLIRAIWRAQRWLDRPENLSTASEILARSTYLDVNAEIIERALSGHLTLAPGGPHRRIAHFLRFFEGAAGFPWRSQAAWIGDRLAVRSGLDRETATATARTIFRTDIYRAALAATAADLPGASEKVEGAIRRPTPVASRRGTLILPRDDFFDGAIFDPEGEN